MRYIKTVGIFIAADILALFAVFTLAGSSSTIIRAVSAVCGCCIMIVIMGDYAFKTASTDAKTRRNGALTAVGMSLSASSVSIMSWAALYISKKTGEFDFYRIYKLINGFALQILNYIEPSADTADVSLSEMMLMLPFAFVPAIAFILFTFCCFINIEVKNAEVPEKQRKDY